LNQKFATKMENEILVNPKTCIIIIIKERKESEIRIQKVMEEKTSTLRTDIAKESKAR